MSGGFLVNYAQRSIPPEMRVDNFVAGETRLTWTSLFYQDFPNAEIYLVGGTLRDVILGKLPNDIDVVIRNVTPEGLEHWLNAHGAAEYVGSRFGTFKFVPHGCAHFEPLDIALPRTEAVGEEHASGRKDLNIKSDFRLPIKEDLARRDFTVNAMAYEIRHGRLIDPFMGLHDLSDGLIRAVLNPQKRFYEDATRLLRALRLASQLGFGIELDTWQAIQDNVELLNQSRLTEDGSYEFAVPREMIGKEFLLGLAHHPIHTLELWQESGALKRFMPEVDALTEVIEADGESAFDKTKNTLHLLFKQSLLAEHGLRAPSMTILVSALMAFVPEKAADRAYQVCKKLHFHQFPNQHTAFVNCQDVMWNLTHLRVFAEQDPASLRPSDFEKHYLNERGRELLLLMHAVFIAEGKHSVARERLHTARRLQRRLEDFIALRGENGKLPRLVTGKDISELGVPEGPAYRKLLDKIRDAQLTEKVRTPAEAKEMLSDLVREL